MESTLRELPCECDAEVTIKIGEPLTDCRAVHGSRRAVTFSVEEGYAVLKEKLRRLVKDDSALTWPGDAGIYIKATVNARQRTTSVYPRTLKHSHSYCGRCGVEGRVQASG
eukprot:jgi/Phyca11/108079/e_gw1.14.828.1